MAGIGGGGTPKNAAQPLPDPKKITIDVLPEAPSDDEVQAILKLSNGIFNTATQEPPTHHSSLDEWHRRLRYPGAIIIRAGLHVSRKDLQNKAPVTPVGFIFGYRTKQTVGDGKEVEAGHIWLAGVYESYQGQGIFGDLMKVFEQYATENGLEWISVATFPKRYGRMFGLLEKTGWKEARREGEKVVMMKKVGTDA